MREAVAQAHQLLTRYSGRIAILSTVLIIAAPLSSVVLGAVRTRHSPAMSTVRTERLTGAQVHAHAAAQVAEPVPTSEIPDERAYSLLFRVLTTMPDGLSGRRARAYMRFMGLGYGCETCARDSSSETEIHEPDIQAFVEVLEEFRREISLLDANAARLAGPSATPALAGHARKQLELLQQQKNELVRRYMAMLPSRVGPEVAARIDEFVQVRFEPRVKYYRTTP